MSAGASGYDTPTGCSGGPAPGAQSLLDRALGLFPGVTNGGIYNCRPSRGGSGWSEHAEGRAIDFMVPGGRSIGDRLAAWAARVPGVQTVIWHDRIWTSLQPTWRPYLDRNTGKPHTDPTLGHRDHVHVGLTRAAAGSSGTGAGINPINGAVTSAGNTVASFGGGLVESAVNPFLEQLQRIVITAGLVAMGVALLVSGGYRAVTGGRKITGDAASIGLEAATTAATGGAGKVAKAAKSTAKAAGTAKAAAGAAKSSTGRR